MLPPHEGFVTNDDYPISPLCQIPGSVRAVGARFLGLLKVSHGKEIYANRKCTVWDPKVYRMSRVDNELAEWKDLDKVYKRPRGKNSSTSKILERVCLVCTVGRIAVRQCTSVVC